MFANGFAACYNWMVEPSTLAWIDLIHGMAFLKACFVYSIQSPPGLAFLQPGTVCAVFAAYFPFDAYLSMSVSLSLPFISVYVCTVILS